jgi:hypothetical protein
VIGAGPTLPPRRITTKAVAPRFVIFEAWALLLPMSGDFPYAHLYSLRLIHQDRSGFA